MQPPVTDPKHVVQPPPQSDPQVNAAAQILLTYLEIKAAIAALQTLLLPQRVSGKAIAAALRISGRATKAKPRQRGIGQIARQAAQDELYYRAAYVLRASQRIQADLDAGRSLREAIIREGRYWRMHEAARRQRLDAHRRDTRYVELFGPILGWYLNPLLNNERECIAANGHNYDALVGTVIGRPGTVHTGCGCTSGPPIEGAGWVDDAVAPHIVKLAPRVRRRKAA